MGPDPQDTVQLAPEVRQLIRAEQERGYRNLAIKLGLGANPEKAYERLSGVPVSETLHSPYEHPNRYLIMERLLVGIQKGMADAKMAPLQPTPAFATLPSGNVSARLIIERTTRVPVIFFEQGLFEFFRDFCHLIGWAVPPLSPHQLSDDEALTKLVHRYTMPFQASDFFIRSLGSYAFEGSPMLTGQRVPAPQHNMPVCMALLTLMERFVMCHEIGHIISGHLGNPPGPADEFEADACGMVLVTWMTGGDGVGWSVGYWACELALIALQFLYLALETAEFGSFDLTWIDDTHPDPIARRDELRQIWLDPRVPPVRVSAARELCGMSDSLCGRLWEFVSAALFLHHKQGERASPMWQALIHDTFAKKS